MWPHAIRNIQVHSGARDRQKTKDKFVFKLWIQSRWTIHIVRWKIFAIIPDTKLRCCVTHTISLSHEWSSCKSCLCLIEMEDNSVFFPGFLNAVCGRAPSTICDTFLFKIRSHFRVKIATAEWFMGDHFEFKDNNRPPENYFYSCNVRIPARIHLHEIETSKSSGKLVASSVNRNDSTNSWFHLHRFCTGECPNSICLAKAGYLSVEPFNTLLDHFESY